MDNAMNEMWKAQQDAATRLTESWRTLLQPAAAGTARPPESAEAGPGENADGDVAGEVAAEVVEPEPAPEPSALDAIRAIEALRDGQRDMARYLTRWAELHRDLADTTTAWASRQSDHAEALDRLLAPFAPGPVEPPV